MLGNARLLATGLILMVAGALTDADKSWVVIATGLALVTAAVLHSLELELLSRVATSAPPYRPLYAYGVQPANAPQLVAQSALPEPPPPPRRTRSEVITRERVRRERHW